MEIDLYRGFKEAWLEAQQQAQQTPPGSHPLDANRALLFERFYPKMEDARQKQDWLKKFEGKCGDASLLKASLAQRQAMAAAMGGQVLYFATQWRFVSGTGNPHPVENGMQWHPTLCVPYLPAAGVKGLAHAFAAHWEGWADSEAGQCDLKRIFGSSENAGSVEFYDLLPHEPLQLMVDVMTPHYGDWYAKGDSITSLAEFEKIPAPWHNPVPIPFLVVEKAEFTLMLRGRGKIGAADVACVAELLANALEIAGGGAKTGSGYGRMQHDATRGAREAQAAEDALQEQARAFAAAQEKTRQAQEEQARREEKARLQALPAAEKIAGLLLTLHAKPDKETATWLIGKKFEAWLKEQGVGVEEVKAALWQDAELLARVRRWNGKKGDEAQAWQRFAPPKKK
jgi:CRISPR-associated protein Cmr6